MNLKNFDDFVNENYEPSWKKGNVSTYTIGGQERGLAFMDPRGTRKYKMSDQEWEEWQDMNTGTRERVAKKYYQQSELDTRKRTGYEKYLDQGGRDWD